MQGLGEFGPYELRRLIGRGGAGVVYEAFDRGAQRVVALKVLAPHHADEPQYRARFRREARLAARLRDPHVIPIHTYGEMDGRLYLDMRLVEGTDLEQLVVDEGVLAPERAVAIVGQVAGALAAAHADGLIHRDVKPSNILVAPGYDGEDFAYLADFGISRSAGASSSGLTHGTVLGTADYVAPEQCRGEAEARSDVYALGCVLFRCVTGAVPFPGRDLPAVLSAHLWEEAPLVSERAPHLGTRFDDVVRRALAKNPVDRLGSPVELARLARQAVGGPTGAPAGTAPSGAPTATPSQAPSATTPLGLAQLTTSPPAPSPSTAPPAASPAATPPSTATPQAPRRAQPADAAPSGTAAPPGTAAPSGSAAPIAGSATATAFDRAGRTVSHTDRRRARLAGIAIATAVLLLIGVGAAVLTNIGSSQESPAVAQPLPVSTALPRVVSTLAVPGRPETVAVGLDGTRAYMTTSDPDAPALHVIDTGANRVIRSVPLPGIPRFVAVSPATGNVYVSYNDAASDRLMLAGYDVRLERIVKRVPTGQPQDRKTGQTWLFVMAISPDGKRVYVPHHDESVVSVVDTDRNEPVAQIRMPRNPHSVAIAPDQQRAWITAHASGEVDVIDLTTNALVGIVPIAPGASPHDVDVSSDGRQVQVANFDAGTVSWVDVATNRVAGTIDIGGKPQSIVFSPDGRRSYVVDNAGSRIVTIDSATHQVTGSVPVGPNATMVALSPDGTRAYVSSRESGTITTLLTAS